MTGDWATGHVLTETYGLYINGELFYTFSKNAPRRLRITGWRDTSAVLSDNSVLNIVNALMALNS
jgi:hypothetical protein